MVIGYYVDDTTEWVEVFNDRNPQEWDEKEMLLYKDDIYIRTGVQYMDEGVHRYGSVEVRIEWVEAINMIYALTKVYGEKYFAM
ncbi:MAG: hypothetical protein IKW35_07590 [Paludibacteraceae bacterium]|nr:hypothetical protein [Paludibacteraceae bacterium]